ncbi:MAG: zf-HC2 domain-containing protein [Pseudolysinimonas sp.]
MSAADHTRFAEWDAAYVLGALSPAERREFESHLPGCKICRASIAELGALPGLLGRLDATRAFAVLDDSEVAAGPPADLVARIERADHTRRTRRRFGTIAGLAAAAAIAAVLALVLPPVITPAPAPAVAAELVPVDATVPVEASIELTPVGWGTRIDMECGYHPGPAGPDGAYGPVEYAMWVVDRQGAETALSTWTSAPEGTVEVSAGTALALADIAQVEVRTVSGDQILLSADL